MVNWLKRQINKQTGTKVQKKGLNERQNILKIIIVVHVFQGREDQYLLELVMWTVIM